MGQPGVTARRSTYSMPTAERNECKHHQPSIGVHGRKLASPVSRRHALWEPNAQAR